MALEGCARELREPRCVLCFSYLIPFCFSRSWVACPCHCIDSYVVQLQGPCTYVPRFLRCLCYCFWGLIAIAHTLAHHVLLCASSECLLRTPRQRADMWNRSRPKVGPWVQNTVSETRVGCSGLSVLCRSRDRLSARDSRRTFLIHRILFSTPKKDPLILRLHELMSAGYSTFCLAVRSPYPSPARRDRRGRRHWRDNRSRIKDGR